MDHINCFFDSPFAHVKDLVNSKNILLAMGDLMDVFPFALFFVFVFKLSGVL
jgi:hypothetical protein